MAAQKKTSSNKEKNLLNDIVFKYVPFWPLFLICICLGLVGAKFYIGTLIPVYEGTASIMLKDENKGSSDGAVVSSLDQLSGKNTIENEVEVLHSRSLMQRVVNNLNLYVNYFEKDNPAPIYGPANSPVLIQSAEPQKIVGTTRIDFSFNSTDSMVVMDHKRFPINKFVTTDYGLLKFTPNAEYTPKSNKPLQFTLMNPVAAAGGFLGGLSVAPASKLSTVVGLRIRDLIPQRCEDILNELIRVYNEVTVQDKSRLAAATSQFVEGRLAVVENELREIEQKAQAYKSSRDAVDISSQGRLFLTNVSENDQKVASARTQLTILSQVKSYVQSKDTKGGVAPSTMGLSDPTMNDLLNKLFEAETKYEKLKRTTGENNPLLVGAADEVNKLKPLLMENIASQESALNATVLNLSATSNRYSSVLQSLPQKERELIDINRQQAIKSGIYSFLLQKKEESDLTLANNTADSRLVDKAQASFIPVAPKPKLIYIVAFIFALAIPIAFVSIKEFVNRKILFRHEIESLTKAPIIGEIMMDNGKDPLVIQEGKRTFIAEQFRRIRTSLGHLGVTPDKKRILVTSSLSGEGKSFVALNLALSLAVTKKKVVLLELDLANPSQSKKLQVDYEQGVSSYLWGECEPEEIIKRTSANENLFFIPAGPLPNNPSELLLNDRLKDLLNYLDNIFDNIIIDSAPASLLSDAYVLSPLCNATLYVVKHKFTPKIYIERLDEENEINHLENLGIIFNGIKSRGFTKNGYGYGYGYGYIHNNNDKKVKKPAKSNS